MTLRKKILYTPGLAFIPLLPSFLFRAVVFTDDFSQVEWRLFVGFWVVVALVQLFRAWPPSTPAYGAWLKATPWAPGKPLPKGGLAPSRWLWLSAAISGAVSALTFGFSPLLAPLAFASGWTILAIAITISRLGSNAPSAKIGDWWVVYFSVTSILAAMLWCGYWLPGPVRSIRNRKKNHSPVVTAFGCAPK